MKPSVLSFFDVVLFVYYAVKVVLTSNLQVRPGKFQPSQDSFLWPCLLGGSVF